jgi:hypothetical protein
MVPINTSLEYEEAIKDELLYLEDSADSIEDIIQIIDGKDDEAILCGEVRALKRIAQDLYDTSSNLTKLVEDYTIKLAGAIPGPGE